MSGHALATFVTGFVVPATAAAQPLHHHQQLEIVHHPASAGVSRLAGGGGLAFAAGDTCLYPPGTRHDRRLTVPGPSLVLRLLAVGRLPCPFARPLLVRGPLPAWLAHELDALTAPQAPCGALERLALDHRASAVLVALLARAAAPAPADPDAALVQRAERLIAERFPTLGRLEDLAAELGVGYDHLRRTFRRLRGHTLVACLTAARIRRAQELFACSRLSHQEIAAQCGYASARYLTAVFHRHTGLAPAAWRRRQVG